MIIQPKQSKRAAVRARAFEQGAGTSRARRHRKVQIVDMSSPEAPSRAKKTGKRPGRKPKPKKAIKSEVGILVYISQ